MNRFHRDDGAQKAVRDIVIGPGLYGQFSQDGRYVYIDKGRMAMIIQRRLSCDTVLQSDKDGSAVGIEEKIVRWNRRAYTALTLETKSCTNVGHESDGWMVYGEADWLNYAMCQENGNVLCYLIDFQKLKEEFWKDVESFRETVTTQYNHTACSLVPIKWVDDRVGICRRMLYPTQEGIDAVCSYNSSHYKKL